MPFWNRGSSKRAEDSHPDQRRTHKNDEISRMIQALSLEVESQHREDGSPTASLISIGDNEYQIIRKSPEWRNKLGTYLDLHFTQWTRMGKEQAERGQLNKENPDDAEDTNESRPLPQTLKKNPKLAVPFLEEKIHGQAQPIVFPQYLFVTANAKIHIPLGLLTTKILKRLCNQKEYNLDITKICNAFGIADSNHPTQDFSYVEFMDSATTNFYKFQCERNPDRPEGQEAHNFGYDEGEDMRRWQMAERNYAIDKSMKEIMASVGARYAPSLQRLSSSSRNARFQSFQTRRCKWSNRPRSLHQSRMLTNRKL
ncbi:hypothetical protein K435DRAFT_857908 [Dendrothele bispora CBS 962.96]|uniref:Uncharacterized protein n=1 Tax=Dendrothele bispora (strain CBS 962.96) TaxID=1314807 RepID=A0A4S8M4I5_DENBC|nr:hypothetical protein K435DRAFT_857908 [Dendrothele bispora CBS 962.96]